MNISTPPTLRSPSKATPSSHLCPTSTSKLLRIILSIGAVGLLLINQNYQGYDNLDNTSSLRDQPAVTSKDDDDANKDRQLRKPQQTAVEEEPQLDFAVVGFEKTGASLDAHIMCVSPFTLYSYLQLTMHMMMLYYSNLPAHYTTLQAQHSY